MIQSILHDVRFAWRGLRRSAGFTALALGIGANSAIFTVVNAVIVRPLSHDRFSIELLSAFAVLALAAIGIYGVRAFVVGRRTRAIGIRIALGARPAAVVGLVLREARGLAVAGVAAGALESLAAARLLRGLLFET